jgi:salicylate biosynthesis isochorismate synthase
MNRSETILGSSDCGGPGAIRIVSFEAPLVSLEHVLEGAFLANGVLWHDPALERGFAGFGEAHRVSASGPRRFEDLAEAHTRLPPLLRLGDAVPDDLDVRYFGGAAFLPGAANEQPWAAFGDADFRLPRFLYARSGERAFLHSAIAHDESPSATAREIAGVWAHLLEAESEPEPAAAEIVPAAAVHMTPIDAWIPYIETIRRTLVSGAFHKLVAHRRTLVEIGRATTDLSVLRRLREEMSTSLRFAFRRGDTTFLGATPETLFRLERGKLYTEALAGTLRSAGTDAPRLEAQSNRLMASPKDMHEHRLVVDQIDECLSPLCDSVEHASSPGIKKVRNILHLNTPIEAIGKPGVGWPSFLAALHPTPAVGGLPKANAAEWLAAHESTARGWYASPIGWFTPDGAAHFAVALRCGVLAYPNAYLYSGAGIVPDSSPMDEYTETSLKLMPMLTALSVETATLRSTFLPGALGMRP